jgi:methionyl-tRNA synthetase
LKDNLVRLEKVLNTLLNGIYAVLSMIEVIMPNNSQELLKTLNLKDLLFSEINNFKKFDKTTINEHTIIFSRLKV